MNKKTLTAITIVLLLIVVGVVYLMGSSSDENAKQEMVNQKTDSSEEARPATQPATNSQPGTYTDYSQTAIADATGTKLLFFHAPWCPQCRDLETDITNSGVPSGVAIIKVDYDTNQALRQKYGVTLQTTVVRVDDQGNLVNKFVAYDNPSLNAIKENLL